MFDPYKVKKDFPIFKKYPDLVYLDSGASSLKPQQVIAKEDEYYQEYSANIFRGIYKISEKATQEYEATRKKVSQFIGAKDEREVIFVRNTTEAINLVMYSWGKQHVTKGDEIVITIMEHHANFVTWQELCKETGALLKIVEITQDGLLNLKDFERFITPKTKLVAFTHISNVLGTINPVKEIMQLVKRRNQNTLVLIDGAQAVPHAPVDVIEIGCDFYAFSSHKMLGPTGVGVLWGRYKLLHDMKPYQFGGEMIEAVYKDHTIYKDTPHKFEAGTPHIAGVIALGSAIDYLQSIGMDNLREHEQDLISYALEKLTNIPGVVIIGTKNSSIRSGVMTFVIDKIHAHDIAQVLDSNNICIRSGHHCAMPLHIELGLAATARATFHVFTTREDIDRLVEGLYKVKKLFT